MTNYINKLETIDLLQTTENRYQLARNCGLIPKYEKIKAGGLSRAGLWKLDTIIKLIPIFHNEKRLKKALKSAIKQVTKKAHTKRKGMEFKVNEKTILFNTFLQSHVRAISL